MATQKNNSHLYFDPVRIGQSLKEVGVDYIEVESNNIETRWFKNSDSQTDVFIWFDKAKKIIKLQISYHGQLVEWNILDGIKTGYVFEREIQNSQKNNETEVTPASETVFFDNKVNRVSIKNAIQILENMDSLDPVIKENMIRNLSLIARNPFKSYKTSFWNKLLSVFKKTS